LREDKNLRAGLNVHGGRVTYWAVAEALGLSYEPADKVLAA
jgi:alanine dehydrogenase